MSNFRFAVMGAGGISSRFCRAVSQASGCEVVAISSRSFDRAKDFASRHGIPSAYGSYEEMLLTEKPDCVYIGTVTSTHYELTMLCLKHGIPVLCEKAMFCNSKDAKTALSVSQSKGIFAMEAMWSRFLPTFRRAKSWLSEGRIGRAVYCDFSIGFIAPEGDDNRYRSVSLGGGAAYDIGVYAYEMTEYMFSDMSSDISSVSVVRGSTEVDMTEHVVLRFPELIASFTASFECPLEERMVIYGTDGKIVLPRPHFGPEALLYDKRGALTEHFIDTNKFDGFVYEIEEAMRCVRAGEFESKVVPHRSTLNCARLFDLINSAN